MVAEEVTSRAVSFESYRQRITNFSNEFDLGLFIHIFRRSLPWVVLVLMLAGASAALYLRYTVPIHQSRSVLQLGGSNQAKQVLLMNSFMEEQNFAVDLEFMRSRFFLGMALDRLPLRVSYFNRGQILTEEYYVHSFFKLHDLAVTDSIVLDQPVFLDLANPGQVGLSYTVGGRTFKDVFPRDGLVTMPHFTARITIGESPILSDPDAKTSFYFKINSRDRLLEKYANQVWLVSQDYATKVVEITCRDPNPYVARDLAQSLAETYIDYDVQRQSSSAASVITFIRSQKDTAYKELRDSEYIMQGLQSENRVSDMAALGPLLLERTNEYEDELVRLTLDVELLKAMERASASERGEISAHDLLPLLLGTKYETTLSMPLRNLQDRLDERDMLREDATASHPALSLIHI